MWVGSGLRSSYSAIRLGPKGIPRLPNLLSSVLEMQALLETKSEAFDGSKVIYPLISVTLSGPCWGKNAIIRWTILCFLESASILTLPHVLCRVV